MKAMNAKRKIVIHTVGVGKTANPQFLKRLAKENGGKFVHRK